MKRIAVFASLCFAFAAPAFAQGAAQPDIARYKATEIARWPAPEARQGAAVDSDYFYAIVNTRIGKYDKTTGVKVGGWIGDGVRIKHLNSCLISSAGDREELVCAHSNFPQVPMASSVEIFDTKTLRHIRSVPLGLGIGSLTWIERRGEEWWAGFANYDAKGGEPGRDHRFTQIVIFDGEWRRTGGYRLPDSVLERFAPFSNSGGSWGDDGLLYLTGHDAEEIYVLREPDEGTDLIHFATISVPLQGQAWAWDRSAGRVVYGISRENSEVIAVEMPEVATR